MIGKGITLSIIFILAMVTLSLWSMGQLPEDAQFAIHWNAKGVADGFAGAAVVLWMMPAMALGISALLAVVPFLDPRKSNLIRSSTPFLVAWIGTMLVLAFAHMMVVLNATGQINISDISNGPGMIKGLAIVIGGFFTALGAVMGKIRPNWFMGIRTPWTLSSDLSWDKTHRLGGYLFLATGLLTVLSALVFTPSLALLLLVGGALTSIVIAIIYSWWAWKNDPVRETLVPEDAD